MNNASLLTVCVALGLVVSAGCATMQTWPDYERSAENKMVVIQEDIGDGLKTGSLSPDQAQVFLSSIDKDGTTCITDSTCLASR